MWNTCNTNNVVFVFTSSVLVKVVTPICTEEIGLPKTDPTTIFAPVPLVPKLSNSKISSTLYPSPLEKIVTEEIPELLVLRLQILVLTNL